jgi:hypothetical protein
MTYQHHVEPTGSFGEAEIQRGSHEVNIEKDAHGWHAVCACGWERYSITREVIDRLASKHIAEREKGGA